MHQKPIILVTGATGAQGGSVATSLLQQHKFAVRILTRNIHSAKATQLRDAGAEVVPGDLDDPESLKQAMTGCYGVFGITNFWEHFEQEYRHGKNLIDAVQQSGIQHFVMSTLPNYHALSNGELSVPHCDLKAALETYAKSLRLPATFIHISFYYENFLHFFPLQKSSEGYYYFGFPQGNTKLAMASVADLGGVVATIFDHPVEYIGRVVGVVGEDRTCAEYAAIMTKVLGQEVRYQYVPRETYASLGFPGAEELANMFEVQRLYIPNRLVHLIESYALNPDMQTFETWLIENRARFPIGAAEAQLELA